MTRAHQLSVVLEEHCDSLTAANEGKKLPDTLRREFKKTCLISQWLLLHKDDAFVSVANCERVNDRKVNVTFSVEI